jgi:thioredoxin-dependent peroxiredoxin
VNSRIGRVRSAAKFKLRQTEVAAKSIVMPTAKKPSANPSKKPAAPTAKSDSAALEGKKAPAFELLDADGNSVALKDLIGSSSLVLYFYPKDMTPGCTVEACSFRDNIAPIKKLGAKVVGVSGDSTDSHGKFIAKHELNFPLLADPGNKVGKLYGVYKMKSLYGRQFMGIERTTFIIDKVGIVRRVFPKVKVNGHTEEVMEALREIA